MSDPDKTPLPTDHLAMILERLTGFENSQRAGFALLDSKIDAVIDGHGKSIADMRAAVAGVKDATARLERVTQWLRKASMTTVEALDKFQREAAAFQEHVFEQFQFTRSIPPDERDDHENGNGKTGTNGE